MRRFQKTLPFVLFIACVVSGCDTDDAIPYDSHTTDPELDPQDWNDGWASLEEELLELINQTRAKGASCGGAGTFGAAPALSMQPNLRTAARLHSQDMGRRGYFGHDSPGGPNGDNLQERCENAGYEHWITLAENVAAVASTAQKVLADFMSSDGHCANIMSKDFTEIGLGYAQVSGSPYTHYWTQVFGRRFPK